MKSFMFLQLYCEIVLANATCNLNMAGPLPLLNMAGQTSGHTSKTTSNNRNIDIITKHAYKAVIQFLGLGSKHQPTNYPTTKQCRKHGVNK